MFKYRVKDTVQKISQARLVTKIIRARSFFARSETLRALMKSKRGTETDISMKTVQTDEEVQGGLFGLGDVGWQFMD